MQSSQVESMPDFPIFQWPSVKVTGQVTLNSSSYLQCKNTFKSETKRTFQRALIVWPNAINQQISSWKTSLGQTSSFISKSNLSSFARYNGKWTVEHFKSLLKTEFIWIFLSIVNFWLLSHYRMIIASFSCKRMLARVGGVSYDSPQPIIFMTYRRPKRRKILIHNCCTHLIHSDEGTEDGRE